MQPIIQNASWLDYPLERVPASLAAALSEGRKRKNQGSWAAVLECYLQVTDTAPLSSACMHNGELKALLPGFVGAVYSRRLLGPQVSLQPRYNITRAVLRAVVPQPGEALVRIYKSKGPPLPEELRSLYPKVYEAPPVQQLAAAFEQRELNTRAVDIWSGWPVVNAVGKVRWLPLRGVYEKFGAEWTAKLHAAVRLHSLGNRGDLVPGVKELCEFLGLQSGPSLLDIQHPASATIFWRELWQYYVRERSRTASHRVVQVGWRDYFADYAHKVLIGSGLIAPPFGELPGNDKGRHLNAAATEPTDDVPGTLLVDIPRNVSDSAAWDFLLLHIPESISRVRTWAEKQASVQWQLHSRRKRWAAQGRLLLAEKKRVRDVSAENLCDLKRAAAHYEKNGHPTREEVRRLRGHILPTPVATAAKELGLPHPQSLLAHAALLVLEHPQITGAYLESLEVWNKDGKLVGLDMQAGRTYLVGVKHRKRVAGQQRIQLSKKSLRVVRQVLAMTRPLRDYLKKRGDDKWRRLFLSAPSFGTPAGVSFSPDATRGENRLRTAIQLEQHCGLGQAGAQRLADRLTLKSLRKTRALLVFIETHSEKRMSEVLGHSEYNRFLLSRYLPPALLAFFQARWVRAFQASLLTVVLEGSPYRLRAIGLKSDAELEQVLSGNSLQPLRDMLQEVPAGAVSDAPTGRFVFNANHQTLAFAREAASADAKPTTGEGLFWQEFSKHLLGVLEVRREIDPELDQMLKEVAEPGCTA